MTRGCRYQCHNFTTICCWPFQTSRADRRDRRLQCQVSSQYIVTRGGTDGGTRPLVRVSVSLARGVYFSFRAGDFSRACVSHPLKSEAMGRADASLLWPVPEARVFVIFDRSQRARNHARRMSMTCMTSMTKIPGSEPNFVKLTPAGTEEYI